MNLEKEVRTIERGKRADIIVINRELLEAGLARYKARLPYSVSNFTACVYRIVEREARKARKGMWQRSKFMPQSSKAAWADSADGDSMPSKMWVSCFNAHLSA